MVHIAAIALHTYMCECFRSQSMHSFDYTQLIYMVCLICFLFSVYNLFFSFFSFSTFQLVSIRLFVNFYWILVWTLVRNVCASIYEHWTYVYVILIVLAAAQFALNAYIKVTVCAVCTSFPIRTHNWHY